MIKKTVIALTFAVGIASASSFTVMGVFLPGSDAPPGFSPLGCSNSGELGAGCGASSPGFDVNTGWGVYNTGGASLQGTFGVTDVNPFGPPVKDNGVQIVGNFFTGADGLYGYPDVTAKINFQADNVGLPSEWGNIGVYGATYEFTDQYSGMRSTSPSVEVTSGPNELFAQQGSVTNSPFLGEFQHTPGTNFSFNVNGNVSCCEEIDSGDYYYVNLYFVDAGVPDAPEPASIALLGGGLVGLYFFGKNSYRKEKGE